MKSVGVESSQIKLALEACNSYLSRCDVAGLEDVEEKMMML